MNNKKEKNVQMNLKNQEVSKMSTANIPYSKQQLLKWSAFRIEKSDNHNQSFQLIHTPLVDLVKQPGYEKFKDRLNWLYNNYSAENYQIVWSELQQTNERRREHFIQQTIIAKADYILNKQVEDLRVHFGPIPKWIKSLTDNQRQLLLDRARTCYGLEPEEFELETKQVYTVPQQVIKECKKGNVIIEVTLPEDEVLKGSFIKKVLKGEQVQEVRVKKYEVPVDEAIYYSQEELNKTHHNNNYFTDVVGRVKVHSQELKRLAEDAVIRDASWFAKFNDTEFDLREHREVEDTSLEEKLQDALNFIEHNRGKYTPEELLSIVQYLYDIDLSERFKNKMVPITDMQGPDSPYDLDIEFRDFQEPIYGEEDEGF